MDNREGKKFSWCPVCMIHTYHARTENGWKCVHENHEHYLRERTDPYIEKYRRKNQSLVAAPSN